MAYALAVLAFLVVVVLFLEVLIMASVADVQTSLDANTAAIRDLAARIPGPAAATAEQLDSFKSQIDTNTAAIVALAPAPTV